MDHSFTIRLTFSIKTLFLRFIKTCRLNFYLEGFLFYLHSILETIFRSVENVPAMFERSYLCLLTGLFANGVVVQRFGFWKIIFSRIQSQQFVEYTHTHSHFANQTDRSECNSCCRAVRKYSTENSKMHVTKKRCRRLAWSVDGKCF